MKEPGEDIIPFDEAALRDIAYENLIAKAAGGSNTAIQTLIKHDSATRFEQLKQEEFGYQEPLNLEDLSNEEE